VSLVVEPGAIGLVGQNGAGKSTFMQILLGLIRPSHGTARVLGHDVRASGIQLRGRIGYMPERDAVVSGLNGIEYAALAGELCGMPRKQALRRAHETLSWLGMDEARYRRLEQYTVGMKQRLKLAATLVHDPEVLLLDEPTAGLDPDGRADMLSVLSSLAARPDKSLVLSSHLLGDVERVCTSAVVLDRGQVVGTGRIDDMCRSGPTCYRIRWQGEGDGFLTELGELGCDVRLKHRAAEASVVVPHDWTTRTFFATAGRHAVVLTGLEPAEEDFEAVYHRLISDNEY
jgi:ABC-2 type transport system ATP-binding protein